MATFGRKKGVWVAVYVERPRRRTLLSSNSHQPQHSHHHHHHHHLHLHQAKNTCNNSRGYNRKAQLLDYTRQLRESARPQPSSLNRNHHRQPMPQMMAVQKKRHSVTRTRKGSWKLLIPGFLRSLFMPRNKKTKSRKRNTGSAAMKIKAIAKSFQVKKKGGFGSKMFGTLRKRR